MMHHPLYVGAVALVAAAMLATGCDPVYTTEVDVAIGAETQASLRSELPVELRLIDSNDPLGRVWSLGVLCEATAQPFAARHRESAVCAEEQRWVAFVVPAAEGAPCGPRDAERIASNGVRQEIPSSSLLASNEQRAFVGTSSSNCGEGEALIDLDL